MGRLRTASASKTDVERFAEQKQVFYPQLLQIDTGAKLVANAPNRLDKTGMLGVILDFPTQLAHEHIDTAIIRGAISARN